MSTGTQETHMRLAVLRDGDLIHGLSLRSSISWKIPLEDGLPLVECIFGVTIAFKTLSCDSRHISPIKAFYDAVDCLLCIHMRSYIIAVTGWIGQFLVNFVARLVEHIASAAR